MKATYETEKTEVDVDQIVKDLQTKVRVVAFRLQLAALLPFSPWGGLARPLTASIGWPVGPCGEQDVRGNLRRRRGRAAVAVVHHCLSRKQRPAGELITQCMLILCSNTPVSKHHCTPVAQHNKRSMCT